MCAGAYCPDNPVNQSVEPITLSTSANEVRVEDLRVEPNDTDRAADEVEGRGLFVTKDSGERAQFDSGMQRDTESGKARFDLLIPEGVPYEAQFLTRIAELMGRGAEKYEDRNWEKANSEVEIARAKSSAFRHFMQWLTGETDEDHAAATVFNLLLVETTKHKIENPPKILAEGVTTARFLSNYEPSIACDNPLCGCQ